MPTEPPFRPKDDLLVTCRPVFTYSGLLLAMFLMGAGGVGAVFAVHGFATRHPSLRTPGDLIAASAIVLVTFGLGAWCWWMHWPQAFFRAEVGRRGVRWSRFGGEHWWPWEDITTLHEDAVRFGKEYWWPSEELAALWVDGRLSYGPDCFGTSWLTLVTRAGERLLFRPEFLSNSRGVMDRLRGRFVDAKLPAALEAYDEGKTIPFGPVGVSCEGVSARGETLPWADLESIEVRDGKTLTVRDTWRQEFFTCGLSGLPNAAVLFALLGTLLLRGLPHDRMPGQTADAQGDGIRPDPHGLTPPGPATPAT